MAFQDHMDIDDGPPLSALLRSPDNASLLSTTSLPSTIDMWRSSLVTLLDSSRYYPIFINICQHLAIGDIVAISRTCDSLSTVYKQLLPILWNVNRSLKRYVEDPQAFRSQLAVNDAVIAGSFVLQFLDRTHYPGSTLNLFQCWQSTNENDSNAPSRLAGYLCQGEGYQMQMINKVAEDRTNSKYFRACPHSWHTCLPNCLTLLRLRCSLVDLPQVKRVPQNVFRLSHSGNQSCARPFRHFGVQRLADAVEIDDLA